MRKITWQDRHIQYLDGVLKCLYKSPSIQRPSPAADMLEVELTTCERRHSAGLMRVNHTGEKCAQALYISQALCSRTREVQTALQHSAQEEMDHLRWCLERVQQLGSHPSYLNPVWVFGAFVMGLCMGLMGDAVSLGFLAETESQVSAHLKRHLEALPKADVLSYRIVEQMCIDEAEHQATAEEMGAKSLPVVVKCLMAACSKIMVYFAYRF